MRTYGRVLGATVVAVAMVIAFSGSALAWDPLEPPSVFTPTARSTPQEEALINRGCTLMARVNLNSYRTWKLKKNNAGVSLRMTFVPTTNVKASTHAEFDSTYDGYYTQKVIWHTPRKDVRLCAIEKDHGQSFEHQSFPRPTTKTKHGLSGTYVTPTVFVRIKGGGSPYYRPVERADASADSMLVYFGPKH